MTGIGRGADDIPGTCRRKLFDFQVERFSVAGSIISVETAPSQSKSKDYVAVTTPPNAIESPVKARTKMNGNVGQRLIEVETINQLVSNGKVAKIPKIIFVIGGPGSNKATLCLKAVGMNPGWGHIR